MIAALGEICNLFWGKSSVERKTTWHLCKNLRLTLVLTTITIGPWHAKFGTVTHYTGTTFVQLLYDILPISQWCEILKLCPKI
jgi:hypothetical protein